MHITARGLLTGLLLSAGTAGAQHDPPPGVELVNEPCPSSSAVRVAVATDNTITFNGRPVSIDELRSTFTRLPATITEVCYHRTNPATSEPPPVTRQVIEIISSPSPRLWQMSFYWDAGFTQRVRIR